ncbi:hypothetical protein [Actinobacillus vicugnae]|uniref:hypothetical protein n=1 Tax=Actinobacillus vicugnae TaxID=2573093 RepID=UPI001240252B|nr:hypothetical protein [Actinobacillus vicugnae]
MKNFLKKLTALLLFGVTLFITACSQPDFREVFFKNRPCAEIKYQCLTQPQENVMEFEVGTYRLSKEEQEKVKQAETLKVYREIAHMLEIYYPGFWDGVDDEKVKLAWMEKADVITKKYFGDKRPRVRLETMSHICGIIGLGFEDDPQYQFVVKRIQEDPYFALGQIIDYLRFEVLKKDYDVGGTQYNNWSLRGFREGMPPVTRHVPSFSQEWLPDNPEENVWSIYKEFLQNGGKR